MSYYYCDVIEQEMASQKEIELLKRELSSFQELSLQHDFNVKHVPKLSLVTIGKIHDSKESIGGE